MNLIPIVPERQPDETSCVHTCTRMIAKFYGVDVPFETINAMLLARSPFDGARCLKKILHRKVIVRFFEYTYFSDQFTTYTPEEQARHLKNIPARIPIEEVHIASMLRALEEGVILQHALFTLDDVKQLIKQKKPILAGVSIKDFRREQFTYFNHAIIINGLDRTNISYVDPHWSPEKFGQHTKPALEAYAAMIKPLFCAIYWVDE